MANRRKYAELAFEEALGDEWAHDADVVEVPIGNRAGVFFAALVVLAGVVVGGRVFALNVAEESSYRARAESNLRSVSVDAAPRGVIYDRNGNVLAENKAIFSAFLNPKEFFQHPDVQEKTLRAIHDILGSPPEEVLTLVQGTSGETATGPVVLREELTQSELVRIKALNLPTIEVSNTFKREYPEGAVAASLVGYTSFPTSDDLHENPELTSGELIGKMGLEALYDKTLRGEPGVRVVLRDAKGNRFEDEAARPPKMGAPLTLALDLEFQEYFYERLRSGLQALGRTAGVGLAMNPENGEVLALVNFPTFDNNFFVTPGKSVERQNILTSPAHPLFNRAVSGLYTPGSTIKPLVGIAALKENVITAEREIFSPGFLDVPNPYDPERPSRFLDWRPQGNVHLQSAIAQSSNVYFYTVGGGAEGVAGLGITRLREWWQKFGLGAPTEIDFPSEAKGFLPSPLWKEKNRGRPWLLGDTYNVSIGQGDLLMTPIQLVNYIASIANGGLLYKPSVARRETTPDILADLTDLAPEISEVQKGMRRTVTHSLGTAHLLDDLPFPVAAKTGSAQIQNNKKENAFFVGYIPAVASASGFRSRNDSFGGVGKEGAQSADTGAKIAILVLIEESREGSLNAVPIAKDVLNWYYEQRIRK